VEGRLQWLKHRRTGGLTDGVLAFSNKGGTMRRRTRSGKTAVARKKLKKRKQIKKTMSPIERKYQRIFTPNILPSHGLRTDEDSLEQPSELKDVDSTTIPATEVAQFLK
jgi:hypothetical protein